MIIAIIAIIEALILSLSLNFDHKEVLLCISCGVGYLLLMHVCLYLIGNYLSSQWIATKLGRDTRRWQE